MSRFIHVRVSAALLGGLILLPLALATQPAGPKAPDSRSAEEMKKLQGTWQVTSLLNDSSGKSTAAPRELETFLFEFKKDYLTMSKEGNITGGGEPFKYTLDPTKMPRAIDVYFSGDPKEPTQGIYKLEGDELTICIVGGFRDGKVPPRPSEFKATDSAPYSVFVLKRVKDAKPSTVNVFVYPQKLTAKDRLVDGPVDKPRVIEITSETTLIWVDLAPNYYFAHPTEYVLITAQGTRTVRGWWWPVLNGKPLFREMTPYKTDFPVKLNPE